METPLISDISMGFFTPIIQDPLAALKSDVHRWFGGIMGCGHPQIKEILRDQHYSENAFVSRVAMLVRERGRDILDQLTQLDNLAFGSKSAKQTLSNIVLQLMR